MAILVAARPGLRLRYIPHCGVDLPGKIKNPSDIIIGKNMILISIDLNLNSLGLRTGIDRGFRSA